MKSKILLSTLLGGALLAGCTADDALNVDKVAQNQNVNPAAPVFTVSFNDDADMRGTMDERGMTWLDADKMSLYHGGGLVWDKTDPTKPVWKGDKFTDGANDYENSAFLKDGEVRKFDAIYTKAETDGGDVSAMKFTTASMVTEGLAIMIYPADTAYQQTSNNPHIILTNEQDENTKNLTPYVSEVLEIGAYNGADYTHSAGYNRQYDLNLRRIGGQLRLSLNAKNDTKIKEADVDPIKYRKVKVEVAKGSDNTDYQPFTTEMTVMIGQKRNQTAQNGTVTPNSDKVGTNTYEHRYWKFSPWMVPTDASDKLACNTAEATRMNWISTTDLTPFNGKPTAWFTLLPYEDRVEYPIFNADGTAKFGNVTITVQTTYGTVTITSSGSENDKLWSNNAGAKETVKGGLTSALQTIFAPIEKDGPKSFNALYEHQQIAGAATRHLEVDLSKLDMDKLHIQDEANLLNALKVYDAVYAEKLSTEKAVTFILDGNEKGEFVMSKEGWTELEKRCLDANNEITFVPCVDNGEVCKVVVLDNSKGEAAIEVPALMFGAPVGTAPNNYEFNVRLEGDWTYASSAEVNKEKKLGGFANLIVAKDASLNPTGNIAAIKPANYSTGQYFTIKIEKGATMTVATSISADVYNLKLENRGEITIKEQAFLSANKNGVIENCALAQKKVNNKITVTGLSTGHGKIYNYGTLSSIESAGGKVNNYGEIEVMNEVAATLITTNRTSPMYFAKDYAVDNVAGSILLNHGNDQQLRITSGAGLIKLKINHSNPTKSEIGKANYLILEGNCKEITTGDVLGSDGKKADDGIPASVNYIESHVGDLLVSGTYKLYGLIVPEGNFRILADATVTMEADHSLYVKGFVTKAGNLTTTATGGLNYTGYFGGDASDFNNVKVNQ